MRMVLTMLAIVVIACCQTQRAVAQAKARTLQVSDMAHLVNLEEPAFAADGKRVAFIAIRQDITNAGEINALEQLDIANGTLQTLVRGHDVSVPRWSPDGRLLAYLARPAAGAVQQVYLRRAGGATQLLTHAAADVIDFAWSPDGRRIAFVATDLPANRVALAHHHDYFFAGNNDYTATALTPPDHLWVVATAGGRAQRLTAGTWTIAPTDPGGIFSPQIAWTRDGRAITFTRVETTYGGEDENSTLWQVPSGGGAIHKLTAHANLELSPAYSPDGTRLAYWYPADANFLAENTVRTLAAGTDSALVPSLDRNVAGSLWYPDGNRMLLCASDRTQTVAWVVDARGDRQTFPLGNLNIVCDPYSSSTFDAGIAAGIARDGGVVFAATDARHARELYYLAPQSRTPRRLTHFNDFVSRLAIGKMTRFDWNGPNGFAEDGVVTYPPDFDAARAGRPTAKFPVVVLIHGGPGLSNACEFAWEQWPLAQMLASRGYIVFQPNYRGSDNLGNAYMLAIVGDTAQGPADDIMAGLHALEKLPFVDSTRVAVSGWSYGGLLTTWLIGHYHDWRAAVSGAAVNDETEEYNLSISNVQNRYYLGTSPYAGDGARIYAEQSPITYYKNITTPTLIWGTTLDAVVPIPLSYALYHALVDNHVPVRFLVFPAATHGPSNPVQTADLTRFWLDWIERHL
ncbi:MAG: S9 family peptidase [Candidatus Eremiobacteraeota bacterium]|nr:S9 family peptidase [Candidatus Eremiobacteraeota bacterium]